MRVHAVQFNIAWEDKPANHRKVRAMLDAAPPSPGDLVVLPEMFSTGFSMNVATVSDSQTRLDQSFCSSIARDFQVHVLAGIVSTADNGKGLNQSALFSPAGHEVARYTKLHPYSLGKEAAHYLPGPSVLVLRIAGLQVAPLICYDLRFPEAFRHATLQGAQCHIVIANWPSPRIEHWTTLLKARAIENQSYVLGLNRTGSDPFLTYPGRSACFSPKGDLLADLGPEESILQVTLDPTTVSTWRSEFPVLNDMRSDFIK
jgi:omega-amidase